MAEKPNISCTPIETGRKAYHRSHGSAKHKGPIRSEGKNRQYVPDIDLDEDDINEE